MCLSELEEADSRDLYRETFYHGCVEVILMTPMTYYLPGRILPFMSSLSCSASIPEFKKKIEQNPKRLVLSEEL